MKSLSETDKNPNVVLRVAAPVPLRRLFDYLPPAGVTADLLLPGCRVRIPFGKRHLVGVIVGTPFESELPATKLKRADSLLDQEPLFGEALFELLVWSASYYHHPPGEVFATALPKLLRTGSPARTARFRLSATGKKVDPAVLEKRAPRQFEVWQSFRQSEVLTRDGATLGQAARTRAFAALHEKGWLESAPARSELPTAYSVRPGPELNADQRAAADTLTDSSGSYRAILLNGVTGSGKTEVYFEAIAKALQRGEQALVLVPEIGLTPQLIQRFRGRFDAPVVAMHSGLSDGERLAAWRDARDGRAAVVVGTRSAVFVPMVRPGVIVVDEEHDSSYKQQDGFRYSARDLAVARARREDVPVVLASATPSLETLYNAQQGRYLRVDLSERPGSAEPPSVRMIDLRQHATQQGLSTPLIAAVREHLDAGNQVLLFLNRRGYAPTLFCTECGWVAECRRCDARLVLHQRRAELRCHHCNAQQAIPDVCPNCDAELKPVGQGTERIEETLASLFPDTPISRLDSDSLQRRGELERALEDIRVGNTRLIVGTQMLTKGHDFPDLTLVGIIDADQGLFGTDFRSNERLAQLTVQVSGRAGRAEKPGTVLVQTRYPEHPLLEKLVGDGYDAFATAALAEREDVGWPPQQHLALLHAEATKHDVVYDFLHAARRAVPRQTNDAVRLLGPAPAPMERRAGRFRAQLLLQSSSRKALHSLLDRCAVVWESLSEARRVRWALDVDPYDLF